MSEMIHPTVDETRAFMRNIGFSVDKFDITEVYGGFFPVRRVFRIGNQVIKALPRSETSEIELLNLQVLIAHYQESIAVESVDYTVIPSSDYMVIMMPWLGINLTTLGTHLDMIKMGYDDEIGFRGFSNTSITNLIHYLGYDHVTFLKRYKLVHGDIFPNESPNNVVFHPNYNRLFLIDAEALQVPTNWRIKSFGSQVQKLNHWMHRWLVS